MINPDEVEFLELNNGWKALVDADMFTELSKHRWLLFKDPWRAYARRTFYVNGKQKTVFLHNYVLTPRCGFTADHRNANTPFCVLDERRSNLRYATNQQQGFNHRKHRNGASQFKGVTPRKNVWLSQIRINGKKTYLGTFQTETEAATAYDIAATKHFGEFALLNFPNQKD